MSEHYFTHRFANGLDLLVEPVPDVKSAAFTLLAPAGIAVDPPEALGTANLVSDWVFRGAGPRDHRELTLALDNLGVQRHEGAEIRHTAFTAATLAENLDSTLDIFADVVRRPRLEAEHLANCKAGVLQELDAIEDEPSQKLFIELRRLALPDPFGRPVLGTRESAPMIESAAAAAFQRQHYRPNGAILGVAGAVEFEKVRDIIGRLFEEWQPGTTTEPTLTPRPGGNAHIPSDKVQTHIGIAYDSVPFADPDFYNAHGAVGVLSGGMSARLFTEVREKRGLCYAVSASYTALKDRGLVLCHAGTTTERAAETLAVVLAELKRLAQGIDADEVRRVRAGLKASLIMQEESTSARASVLARHWYHLGRVRSLAEVAAGIDALTPESIIAHLERHPPRDFITVTLGSKPLEVPA